MDPVNYLRIAYAANILILVPVVWGMIAGGGVATVFEGKVADSAGLRLLVASLWAAILAASIAGLWAPRFLAPVLLVQIFYKTMWLILFVVPLGLRQGWGAVPWGVAGSFALIVLSYPWLFWLGIRG